VTPCNFFTLWEPILGDACDISNQEAWQRISSQAVRPPNTFARLLVESHDSLGVVFYQPTVPMYQMPHYADSAFAILGRALESVVEMSYEDYVNEHIFKPLGTE
jgi:CubicO group peptidase (beta-lactamase class C family)